MGRGANEVGHVAATQGDLNRFADAEQRLAQMRAPLLLNSTNPHERLYIAALDGTGNSIFKDAQENGNAADASRQVAGASRPCTRLQPAL